MKQVLRYHPALVILHWLLAAMIIGLLFIGFFVLARMPNSEPAKIIILEIHMAAGMGVLALMLVRLVIRLRTAHPPQATIGNAALDRLASLGHYGFYVIVLLMVATGYATGLAARLNEIVFARSGEPLPPTFDGYPTFTAHFYLALLLAALIVVHTAAALYHQWLRKDRLLARMGLGKRNVE
jgi:cytochrome b561